MDKLRKFGEMLWLIKERLILVVMVAILCFQVYKVLYPEAKKGGVTPKPPVAAPGNYPPPPAPPDAPIRTLSGDYTGLHRRNPLWYFAKRDTGRTRSEEATIKLIDLQTSGGRQRAQIQTATTTQWYDVGTAFEQYRLVSVDEGSGSAVVYVEALGREETLYLGQ